MHLVWNDVYYPVFMHLLLIEIRVQVHVGTCRKQVSFGNDPQRMFLFDLVKFPMPVLFLLLVRVSIL